MSSSIVPYLQEEIRRLSKENENLRNSENILKNALQKQAIRQRKEYRKMKKGFGFIYDCLVDTTLKLVIERKRPVHYTEIVKAAKTLFPPLRERQDTTLNRRLQELGEKEILWRDQGYYSSGSVSY